MSSEASESVEEGWTSWFCGVQGHEFFCEVEKSYIEDSFNLFGLKQHLPQQYFKALDTILDRTSFNEAESEEISRAAGLLYGMIHARYIITAHGLEAMVRGKKTKIAITPLYTPFIPLSLSPLLPPFPYLLPSTM
jgi:casein kinase II subunit beta